jgi:hypothetical protein
VSYVPTSSSPLQGPLWVKIGQGSATDLSHFLFRVGGSRPIEGNRAFTPDNGEYVRRRHITNLRDPVDEPQDQPGARQAIDLGDARESPISLGHFRLWALFWLML